MHTFINFVWGDIEPIYAWYARTCWSQLTTQNETDTLSRNLCLYIAEHKICISRDRKIFSEGNHFDSWCWRLNIVWTECVWTGGQIRDAKYVLLEVKSEVWESVRSERCLKDTRNGEWGQWGNSCTKIHLHPQTQLRPQVHPGRPH